MLEILRVFYTPKQHAYVGPHGDPHPRKQNFLMTMGKQPFEDVSMDENDNFPLPS